MDEESQNLPARPDASEPPAGAEIITAAEDTPEAPARPPLTSEERQRRDELEDKVDRWISDGLEVGRALREIRERELFRETHNTFAAYFRDRFGIESSQSYRLMDYARVTETVEEISPMGETDSTEELEVIPPPANERQTRELAKLANEQAKEQGDEQEGKEAVKRVWRGLVENLGGAPASYRQVDEAVETERRRLREAKPGGEAPGASVADPQVILDANPQRILGWHQSKFQDLKKKGMPPEGEVKLLLADPPYGVDQTLGEALVPGGRRIEGDLTPEEAADVLTAMLQTMSKFLAEDAHVVVFCAPAHEPLMRERVEAEGLSIRSYLVWVKNTHGGGDTINGLAPSHERAIHAVKGKPGLPEGKRPRDVLSHSRVPDTEPHPTRKPAALLRELIGAFTTRGDLVADPVGGSGSTLVAAVQRDRRGWGCERDPAFHDNGAARIAEALLQNPAATETEDGGVPERRRAEIAPEAPTEVPEEAAPTIAGSLYGHYDPVHNWTYTPPKDADPGSLVELAFAWLENRSQKPKTLIEPFAADAEVGISAALQKLTERTLLICEDADVDAGWRELLNPRSAIRLLRNAFEGNFPITLDRKWQTHIVEAELTEELPAFRLLLAGDLHRVNRLAARSPDYTPASHFPEALAVHKGRMHPFVGCVRAIAKLGMGGRTECRHQDGLEALADPDLARDPEAAFFVVPPRNVGHMEPLRLLSKVEGEFLAVVEDSKRAIRRAREYKLAVRQLGHGKVADYEYGPLLLIGKDLSFTDE